MNIVEIDTMSPEELSQELRHGGRFVVYRYCVSMGLVTFQRSSDVYLVRAGESGVARGFGYTLVSLLLGWWAIPWGPIKTLSAVCTNLRGGADVTNDVLAALCSAA